METEKNCNNCIYYMQEEFVKDCRNCNNKSNFISHEDFNEDMDFWHGEYPQPEEEKSKYLLIKWLIKKIIKFTVENDCCYSNFIGITNKPKGQKQNDETLPLWLSWYFRDIWVDQYYNGGYSGDDFEGNFYYRLLPFVYLTFNYGC